MVKLFFLEKYQEKYRSNKEPRNQEIKKSRLIPTLKHSIYRSFPCVQVREAKRLVGSAKECFGYHPYPSTAIRWSGAQEFVI